MKSVIYKRMSRLVAGFLVPALCISVFSAPVFAQPPRRPVPPPGYGYGGRPYGPPPPHRHSSDLDKTLAILGTVGVIATIANARNNGYYYHRYPTVVVAPPRPSVVVSRPPVVIEKQVIVEKPVVVERQIPVIAGEGTYSPKLGVSFRMENVQIPGYKFTAARLTSDPIDDSPLCSIGLRKGDVITRLDNNPADSLAELERHEGSTAIRYKKTGTTKVLLANIYIPTDTEVLYYAP